MIERPMLFTGRMVRELRADQKTQTRRLVKPEHLRGSAEVDDVLSCLGPELLRAAVRYCPYGGPGDRLWVRETWAVGKCADGFKPAELSPRTWLGENGGCWYPADDTRPRTPIAPRGKTRVSIHMPRWASRELLELTDVRVERLQSITEEDARAEGAPVADIATGRALLDPSSPQGCHRWGFELLWDSINTKRAPWASNPWVWALTFRRLVRMTIPELRALEHEIGEYSCTIPTGVIPGKRWLRLDGVYDDRCPPADRRWLLMSYGPAVRGADGIERCAIRHARIELVDALGRPLDDQGQVLRP